MTKKVSRNDFCPCGSGKKYKKCCEDRLGPKRKFNASILSSGGSQNVEGLANRVSLNFFSKAAVPQEPRKLEDIDIKHPPEADKPI